MNILKWFRRSVVKELVDNYPKTVAEVLDDVKYHPGVEEAMIRFRKSHPFEGTLVEIEAKFRQLNADLSPLYDIEQPQVVFVRKFVCGSCYFSIGNLIVMEQTDNGYSVITFLHEFGHALGKNEKQTCRWSINLFRKYFPNSYNKLTPKGHILKR